MGDLEMKHFSCADELPFPIDPAHREWSCKCDCEERLAKLLHPGPGEPCGLPCKRANLPCPSCAPPPPPPLSPPSVAETPTCKPVRMACCEAVMTQLTKYCFAFEPKGKSTRVADLTHWAGAKWVVPSAFDKLVEEYWPDECAKVAPRTSATPPSTRPALAAPIGARRTCGRRTWGRRR